MLNKREKKTLITLDIVELILLLASLIVFTVIFKVVEEPIRYVFLFGDAYVIYSFSKTLNSLEKLLEKKEKEKQTKVITEISI